MRFNANAKVNLYLDVLGKDPADGYHRIRSIFQEITLADEIEMEPADRDEIRFESGTADLSGADLTRTTVHKALDGFRTAFGINERYSIRVKKNIPLGAGLGGGSSDAAAVLLALAERYAIAVEEVEPIGRRIGSDVPFFFRGGMCLVEGKGEKVTPLGTQLEDVYFLIVYPNIHVSTAEAYGRIKEYGDGKLAENYLKKTPKNIDFLRENMYNNFQSVVFNWNPRLRQISEELVELLKPELWMMSGSGSSLLFLYHMREKGEENYRLVRQHSQFEAFICDPNYR